uniref:Titin n=1 Tax=Labrus bergylta TaxID=56723 RepID=A0A3Q3E4N5_9LABR
TSSLTLLHIRHAAREHTGQYSIIAKEARKAFTSVCSNCMRNSYKIDNLQEGCFYYFRVLAVNEFGTGLPALITDAVKVSEAPLPPGRITLSHITCNSASISWEKPDHDGGSKIIYYVGKAHEVTPIINLLSNIFSVKAGNDLKVDVPFKGVPPPTVEWKKDGNLLKETSRVNVYTSDTSSQLTIKDATRIDAGMYEVTVANSVGTTSIEIHINVFERPGPPSELNVDEVSADFISLSWQPPHYTGGCEISNYVVEKRDTGSTIWQAVSATVARTSIKIPRLTQGTEYQFRIASENRYGKSQFAESQHIVAHSILWKKLNRNLLTENQFKVTSVEEDSGQYTLTLQSTGGTTNRAVTCKVLDRPGPPAGPLEVSGLTAEKCTLSWGPPNETGGAEVMYYIVEKCETSRVAWIIVYGDMMATTCKITKLLKGNEYLFRVRAVNKYGEGETLESEPVKATDPFTIPSAPTDVEVTSATSDSMTICWKRPATDGGSRISGYIIEKREKQGVRWGRVNKKPVYDLRVKASCLHEGCEYEFRVIAENAAGLSEPSSPCPLTLAEDPTFLPSPPAKPIIVDSSRCSITLSWNKSLTLKSLK